ncbi:MAG TPA: DUF6089 family protein [Flavisolibacter sp.]|jgi:hypothetical protein|nr:DUF6089 family protein [Flavisolibacter sp.]
MRKLAIIVLLSISYITSNAQLRLGVFGGLANYQGDLTDKLFLKPKAAIGITASLPVSERFSLRAGLTFAKVQGADSLSKSDVLKLRNLSFQSPITEFSLLGEFTVFNLDRIRWSPYIFGGIAIYHFDPYTYDTRGNQIFLRGLGTEGQGLQGYPDAPYSLTQFAIPFGGGFKYAISDKVQLGLEIGLRKLFTDHLDDVSGNYADANDLLANHGPIAVDIAYRSDEVGGNPDFPAKGTQRGSPKYKDFYYFTGLHLTFQLGEGGDGLFSGKGKKGGYGCPSVRL